MFELTYPYIIDKKYGYDFLYIIFILLIILHWVYFNNKCILTYLNDKYNNSIEFEFIFGKYINIFNSIFSILFIIIISTNIIIVSNRNNFKYLNNIFFIILPIIIFYIFFIKNIDKYKFFKKNEYFITEMYKIIIISCIVFFICKNL
jgi:hypothetical protein